MHSIFTLRFLFLLYRPVLFSYLSSQFCAPAAQSAKLYKKSKGQAHIPCDDRSLSPAECLQALATGQVAFLCLCLCPFGFLPSLSISLCFLSFRPSVFLSSLSFSVFSATACLSREGLFPGIFRIFLSPLHEIRPLYSSIILIRLAFLLPPTDVSHTRGRTDLPAAYIPRRKDTSV